MSTSWIVLKFGGTSVARADNWPKILEIFKNRVADGYRLLVVHSALAGVSDRLARCIDQAQKFDPAREIAWLESVHTKLLLELNVKTDCIKSLLAELTLLFQEIHGNSHVDDKTHAQIMAYGELLSTTISSYYLRSHGLDISWQDARSLLQCQSTDTRNPRSQRLSASCNFAAEPELQAQLSQQKKIIVTQGFIAADSHGETVLLGRGGSDTSAAYFAAKLQALRLEIWTDVPGLFTANPKSVSTARQLHTLDYSEAQEIASCGGKILHPRCIGPVRHHNIPLHVFALNNELSGGSIISEVSDPGVDHVKAIAVRKGITLVSMESISMWHQAGFLADAFTIFKQHGFSVDLISTSQTNVTISLDPSENILDKKALDDLKNNLSTISSVKIIPDCAAVSLVGRRIRTILHQLGPAMQLFAEHRIYLLNQASNDLNFTVVVDEDQSERLLKKLHRILIGNNRNKKTMGPTWEEIVHGTLPSPNRNPSWWRSEQAQLLSIAHDESPSYVYHGPSIDHAIGEMRSLTAVDTLFYAIKANPHPKILKRVFTAGLGFECVSPGELDRVFSLFPKIDPKRVLFTPNFAPKDEYIDAFSRGVHVTLDNIHPAHHWPEVFAGQKIIIRVDPGHGGGHHKYVRTTGEQSKFGISISELAQLKSLLLPIKTSVYGIHAHSGSGITDYDNWRQVADTLVQASEIFDHCRFLNLGGGLGISETPSEHGLNMNAMNQSLLEFKKEYPKLQLWMEPGRFLVARAGVLLCRINQTKTKGNNHYVGVNAGMNTFIRPALYGAYHDIVNLTRLDDNTAHSVNIVGSICETGDILGVDRMLPLCKEQDILLIANTGAYGAVMASNYNLRKPAREVFLE